MNLLDALMAGLEPLAGMPLSEAAPANPAKAAKSEAACGPAADFEGCEGLRISANPAAEPAAPSQDSQTFAGIRKPENRPQSQQACGFSQDSQLSQSGMGTNAFPAGCAANDPAADPADWRAADVAYQDHHGDCTTCKTAGRGDHHGSRCAQGTELWRRYCDAAQAADRPVLSKPKQPAFESRITFTADEKAQLSMGASAAELDTMTARLHRFARAGFDADTAEGLADKLMLRDRDQDDRRVCPECAHWRPGRCGNHRAAGIGCPDVGRDLALVLRRCDGFDNIKREVTP